MARPSTSTRATKRDDDSPLPCVRCGGQYGVAVWKACSDKEWRVLCEPCDIAANEMLLRFLNVARTAWRVKRYMATMDRRPVTRKRLILNGMLPIA